MESREHYPDFEHFESREKKPVETKIFEYSRYSNGRFVKKREISIFNTEEEEIQRIEGKVILFSYKVDISQEKLRFALSDLGPSHGVKIYDEIIYKGRESWNEFYTYIDRIDIGGKIGKNIKIYGKQIPKS